MWVIAIPIIGIVVLAMSISAWRKNRRFPESQVPVKWRLIWRWRWAIGVAFGIVSLFMRYPVDGDSQRYMVYGIPFMAYAFDAKGHDYVGPLTLPAMALNFAVWGLVPQLILRVIALRWKGAQGAIHDA